MTAPCCLEFSLLHAVCYMVRVYIAVQNYTKVVSFCIDGNKIKKTDNFDINFLDLKYFITVEM